MARDFKIGFDLDGVSFPTPQLIVAHWNNVFGRNYGTIDLPALMPHEMYGVSAEELQRELLVFFHSQGFRDMPPLDGAVEGLRRLSEFGCISYAITTKPAGVEQATLESVRRHFGDLFAEVLFSNTSGLGVAGRETKPQIAHRIGAKVLVDDYLPSLNGCFESGVTGLLFDHNLDYGWCKRQIPEGLGVVRNWNELVDKIEAIAD